MTHGESLGLSRVGQRTSKTTPVVMYFMFSLEDLFMTFQLLARCGCGVGREVGGGRGGIGQ